MFFYTGVILLTVFIMCNLIGLYYFSKEKYDNILITFILENDKLQLLKSKKIEKETHRKLTLILSIQNLLIILLAVIFIHIFKSYNMTLRYIIIISMYIVRFISNKLIEKMIKTKLNIIF